MKTRSVQWLFRNQEDKICLKNITIQYHPEKKIYAYTQIISSRIDIVRALKIGEKELTVLENMQADFYERAKLEDILNDLHDQLEVLSCA